jgi:ABC-type thiamin/hydroxymethylpyrimidine transport system permease subunit
MNYLKSGVAVAAAVLAAVVTALTGDNAIDASEWVNVVILGAGAAAVFVAPNVPGARYTKLGLAIITAMATAAASLVSDGISLTDGLQVAMAALGALGVHQLPNSRGEAGAAAAPAAPAGAAVDLAPAG